MDVNLEEVVIDENENNPSEDLLMEKRASSKSSYLEKLEKAREIVARMTILE